MATATPIAPAVAAVTVFFATLCWTLAIGCPTRAMAQDEKPAGLVDRQASVVVVVGAAGTPEYGEQFRAWTERWRAAAERGRARFTVVGLDESSGGASDRDKLIGLLAQHSARKVVADKNADEKNSAEKNADAAEQRDVASSGRLWLVLLGHGTFDGKTARFNLRGPDFTPAELGEWLKPLQRPVAVVNCASSSGPFLTELSGPDRIVVSATKSGFEYNLARFGDYLSAAIADPSADLDKDEQVSLLEAYLRAAAGVKEFYANDGRLATEHPLLDDNGDRLGTPPDWFQGVRAVKAAKSGATLDGVRAAQWILVPSQQDERLSAAARTRRDDIEAELAKLRSRKSSLAEEEYLRLVEPLLIELARIYSTK